jgi:hypothetical protein
MNLKFLLFFAFVFSFMVNISSQTESEVKNAILVSTEKELVELNSAFLIAGHLYLAELVVDKLLDINPESANYNYRKGFSTLEVYNDQKRAIPYFLKAIEKINNDYDVFSTNEKGAPADAYYFLGKCYHLNEEIDKAEENYKKFIAFSRKHSNLLPVAKLNLLQCAQARQQMAAPVNVFLSNVGKTINSEFPDYSSIVSLDGSALYFTSSRPWPQHSSEDTRNIINNQYHKDIYVSYQDFDGKWMAPKRLDFCQQQRNEVTVAINTDESKIYLAMDSIGNGDIYYSDFKQSDLQDIGIEGVNTSSWETHAVMSDDRAKFFFVSNRKGGFGGRDIYYCDSLGNGKWSSPKNMGPKINTSYDEDSPFITIDKKTLYYSSNSDKSIGGFDVFKSDLYPGGVWSEGINLGYPFNSTNDDLFYTTTVDGLKGYMTSYRNDGMGEKDIYEIKNEYLGIRNMTVLSGNIYSSDGEKSTQDLLLQITISCVECEFSKNRNIFPRLRDGFYLSGLEPCKNYAIVYSNIETKEEIYRDSFSTICDSAYNEIKLDLTINSDGIVTIPKSLDILPLIVQKDYQNREFLKYLGFNENKLSIDQGILKDYLDEIQTQLLDGRDNITIDIYTSASTVPTKTFKTNDALAQKRAKNVRKDLENYFSKTSVNQKVKINIVSALVQGPLYSGDSDNEEKYGPYQYVVLKTK